MNLGDGRGELVDFDTPASKTSYMLFPEGALSNNSSWERLKQASRGGSLLWVIHLFREKGIWHHFLKWTNCTSKHAPRVAPWHGNCRYQQLSACYIMLYYQHPREEWNPWILWHPANLGACVRITAEERGWGSRPQPSLRGFSTTQNKDSSKDIKLKQR